jgi:putative transposase
MPRIARLIVENAAYHVMVRGNRKQLIFTEKTDYIKYFDLLRHYKKRYGFKLYGYCLMPNHVHLILQVKKKGDLPKIMQGLNQTYTIWFNKTYGKVGHLWQGRYKNMVIQNNRYLFECIEYVEFNPIRAGMTRSPFDYPWSSWQQRFGHKNDNLLDRPELA